VCFYWHSKVGVVHSSNTEVKRPARPQEFFTQLKPLVQEIAVGKMIPTHPNLPVFVGWCATESMGPMVLWKVVHGRNLEEEVEMSRERSQSSDKGKGAWQPEVKNVVDWSRQLFSALACLHSHGATLTILHVSSEMIEQ
jgi:hypothetical protein